MKKTYICIDLKSFYASVECHERGLDPLNTNLVVADKERTEKTICLAVSPSLKQYGIPGRARLFEVIQQVKKINSDRKRVNKYKSFIGKSYLDSELKNNINLELDYITATPRMSYYIKYSADIYNTYLKYISEKDIYVYSIDEVFMDITSYLDYYDMNAEELVTKMIKDVYDTTGITATAGIGTNLYLAKIAMDIVAKHEKANEFGVRIATLDEMSYRRILWNHQPLTSFWRVGKGYQDKLNKYGMHTMGDIARCSLENEDILYKLFGVNAELLIDHAWGEEPCTLEDIKKYKPELNSISSGQVLHSSYDYQKTRLIIKEMTELLTLELVKKKLVTDNISLTIGYDIDNLNDPLIARFYNGKVVSDRYGRNVPKPSHSSINVEFKTSSTTIIIKKTLELFDRIINKSLLVKRINIAFNNIVPDKNNSVMYEQLDLFSSSNKDIDKMKIDDEKIKNEKKVQETIINIKKKYGKNAILKGMNLEEGATTIDRNNQIGGHRA